MSLVHYPGALSSSRNLSASLSCPETLVVPRVPHILRLDTFYPPCLPIPGKWSAVTLQCPSLVLRTRKLLIWLFQAIHQAVVWLTRSLVGTWWWRWASIRMQSNNYGVNCKFLDAIADSGHLTHVWGVGVQRPWQGGRLMLPWSRR